ncbi:hypothetical protein GCM10009811_10960 [Nostocoides veronense]|uniref:Uncharacterized protein n=1 Tax=Nostocoides veronense TaxID=330836 RepID=A0ABN2LHD4_9MICO
MAYVAPRALASGVSQEDLSQEILTHQHLTRRVLSGRGKDKGLNLCSLKAQSSLKVHASYNLRLRWGIGIPHPAGLLSQEHSPA